MVNMRVSPIKHAGIGKPHRVSANLGLYHFRGSPREVGKQYGQAFSRDLVQFNGYLKNLLAETAGRFLSEIVYHLVLPAYSLLQWFRVPKPLRQEIKGMAEGAKDLSRFNFVRQLKMVRLSSLYDFMVNFALTGVGCSSFAKRDADGNLLIGRNFDINYDSSGTLERSQVLLYEIEGQRPFITTGPVFFNVAPTTAIVKGENGEPLFFAIHNVIGRRQLFGKPTVTLLRQMANQPSFAKLLELLDRSEETCAKKFILADDKRAAVADVVPDKDIYIKELPPEAGHLAVTNNYQTPRSRRFVSDKEEEHGLNFNSIVRLHSLRQALTHAPHKLEAALAALSNTFDYTRDKFHPWGDIVSPPFNADQRPPYKANMARTYYSVVLDHKEGNLWVGAGAYAPHGDFYGFDLKSLWNWAEGRGFLPLKKHPQNPNYEKLDDGRILSEGLAEAKELYKIGEFDQARPYLKHVLKMDKDHIEARVLRAAIGLELYDAARPEEFGIELARSYLNSVIRIEQRADVKPRFQRGTPFALLLLGMSYDLQGRRSEAQEMYDATRAYENASELGQEAAAWARQFQQKPCTRLPSHEIMSDLIL
jgi:tetratricopeptide (TPR) repeat protein